MGYAKKRGLSAGSGRELTNKSESAEGFSLMLERFGNPRWKERSLNRDL